MIIVVIVWADDGLYKCRIIIDDLVDEQDGLLPLWNSWCTTAGEKVGRWDGYIKCC